MAHASTSQPYATAASRTPIPRVGISLQNIVIGASIIATLGIWGAAGWAWLGEHSSIPPPAIARMHKAAETDIASDRRGKLSPPASFVVLPFANESKDADQEYLAEAITSGLISDLTRVSGSFVIARDTAFSYRETAFDAARIGRELGVRYILEGGVQRAGDRVELAFRLIDGGTGMPAWVDRLEIPRANLIEAPAELTNRLARALNLEVANPPERGSAADPQARDLIMRGWGWCYRPYSTATWQEAQKAFEGALKLDRQSIDARIGLATVLGGRSAEGWSSSTQLDPARAEQLLREVLDQDADRAEAHFAMGVLRQMQNRLSEAQTQYEATISLDPNQARAYLHLGQTLMFLGHPDAAIPDLERAMRLSPRDPNMATLQWALGTSHLLLGQVDEAIHWLQQAGDANPRLWFPQLYLAGALGLRGDLDAAKAALAQSIRLNPAINSLSRMRQQNAWITTPQHWALQEATLNVGLRRAGWESGEISIRRASR
jgi:adenylate cyclase